ncbi:MAG: RDD family protein [Flavobacteriaceae bacterium]|nr:RDD family protein [Flavobacteriaceae bacterium]
MLLDHIIMTFVIMICALISFGITYLVFGTSPESEYHKLLAIMPLILFFLLFSIYFNKDGIKGKSPAKRFLGFVVVDNKTGVIANPIKTVLRNSTLIIWPIEVIVSIFSPSRRIGDYIAGTKLIEDDKTLKADLEVSKLIASYFIGILFLLPLIGIQMLIVGFTAYS